MHIGIDARLYGIEHRGIGRYAEQLVLSLSKQKNDHRYTLFMRPKEAKNINLDKGKFKIVIADAPHYSIKEHLIMPYLIRKAKVEIMHFTHLNVPFFCPVPYVVTIHDLIVYHFPDSRATNLPNWKYRIKVFAYNFILKNAVQKARKIIAVSEFTKRDIVRNLNANDKKIIVIYLGVEKMILGVDSMRNTPQFQKILQEKFGINKHYLLYVGSAYPHKNLEKLIIAFCILRAKYSRNWQLVLVGREDKFYARLKEYVDNSVKNEDIKNDIIFAGEASDNDLDGLYRSAKLFVFPSLYEGFGLPPLEAGSRRTPVACAKSSCIPEIMSDSAYYFDPEDPEIIAAALDKAGGSRLIQDELAQRGVERAKQFSWDKTAKETVAVYKSFVV